MGKCNCKWCAKYFPIMEQVKEKLEGKLKEDFDSMMTSLMCELEDGEVAQIKLKGEWPGWEWIKEVIQEHNDLMRLKVD